MTEVADVAFDSNVLTFFLDANRGDYQFSPQDPLSQQRIAACRLFLFCRSFIVPTVTSESERISNDAKLREHMDFIWYQFAECLPDEAQATAIEQRASAFEPFHPNNPEDCRILAEVEWCQVPVLVTFDEQFKKRLAPHTQVLIETPTESWKRLAIPRGMPPKWSPAPGHPLENQNWWRW